MGLIKWLAKCISENINLATDLELEQELLLLQEKYDELDIENESLHERLITSGRNFDKLAKENKSLVTENNRLSDNYKELVAKRDSTKLKERCIELQKELSDSERMRKLNFSLSQAKSFISDKSNKEQLIECLHHNFKQYVDLNNLLVPQVAEKYGVVPETIRRMYHGTRGTSVTTFDLFEGDLCDFYECMPFDLVTKKLDHSINSDPVNLGGN
ncbi:hypothetical protein P7H41_05490 [Vagococcus fluvialis]|uniref:hypothetical protein n=1 Tax=Vagococcus fluvialis TaxID=2738 RepID=UPI00288EB609|nr:hypothetical protein [Vagococcus fluvialis]MDT2781412.1 hypothetical protein [Vagococcus fluvialis]